MPTPVQSSRKYSFLLRNLLKGLIWLAVIVAAYLYIKKNYGFDLEIILGPFYDNGTVIYSIFLISEILIGIIPPEFFMLWGLRHEVLNLYVQNVIALACISYGAGVIGYYIGSYFNGTRLYRLLRIYFFGKFEKHLNDFGGFLVVVAALTPLPFSGICMLTGAVGYSVKKFMYISLMRFVRFAVYGFIIWEANILN